MPGQAPAGLLLDVFVPKQGHTDVQTLLEQAPGSNGPPEGLRHIVPHRKFFILDEQVTAFVVLQCPAAIEPEFSTSIPRIRGQLEVHASGQFQDPQMTTLRSHEELLQTVTFGQDGQPERVCLPGTVFYIWKPTVLLSRPKERIQNISIIFRPLAAISPAIFPNSDPDEYLEEGAAAPANLLQSFGSFPAFKHSPPYLSAVQISKTIPVSTADIEATFPLRISPPVPHGAAPLLLWRLRYTQPSQPSKVTSILLCVDFEATHSVPSSISISDIDIALSAGRVDPLSPANFPIKCKNGDQLTKVYRLTPIPDLSEMMSNENRQHNLSLRITAEARPHATKNVSCNLNIAWNMNIGFATQTKFGHKRTRSALLNQKTSIEIPLSQASSRHRQRNSVQHTTGSGIVFDVRGPAKVTVGEAFSWEVLVINRSNSSTTLDLYFPTLRSPNRPRGELEAPLEEDDARFRTKNVFAKQEERIPTVFVQPHILFADLKQAERQKAELVCLDPETQVGPLGPGESYSTQVKFLPMVSGVLRLEVMRVVDQNSQQVLDIRDLPDIVSAAASDPAESIGRMEELTLEEIPVS